MVILRTAMAQNPPNGSRAAVPDCQASPQTTSPGPEIVHGREEKMRVSLIGATGNAGSRILAELARRRYEVTAIVRHPERVPQLDALPLSRLPARQRPHNETPASGVPRRSACRPGHAGNGVLLDHTSWSVSSGARSTARLASHSLRRRRRACGTLSGCRTMAVTS